MNRKEFYAIVGIVAVATCVLLAQTSTNPGGATGGTTTTVPANPSTNTNASTLPANDAMRGSARRVSPGPMVSPSAGVSVTPMPGATATPIATPTATPFR